MADYIKRDSVIELAREYYTPALRELAVPVKAIRNIPSADVQPIVHGEWIDIFQREDPDTSVECRCSICEKASRRPVGKYCKWCGARMDGGT